MKDSFGVCWGFIDGRYFLSKVEFRMILWVLRLPLGHASVVWGIVTHFSDPFYLDEDIPRKKSQIKYDKNEIPLINHWKKGLKTFPLRYDI